MVKWLLLLAAAIASLGFTPTPALAQTPASQAPIVPTFIDAAMLDLAKVLPRWPADDSLAGQADLDTVLAFQAYRTPTQEAEANTDAPLGPIEWAQTLLGRDFTTERYPLATALLTDVHNDMRAINRVANAVHGLRLRPAVRDARVKPSLPNVSQPDNPSYPSARTAGSVVWAHVLAELFPERRAALFAAADRTAWLRLLGGAHYPSDLTGGRIVGEAAWAALQSEARFTARLVEAQTEVRKQSFPIKP